MYKYAKVVIILFICVLLAGCQPTPSSPPVANKGENNLEQKMLQTAAPATSASQEERWHETLSKGGMQVIIDALVEIPNVTSWPVLKVKPHGFTAEEVKKVIDVFMMEQPIYEYSNIRAKADIEQDIIWVETKLKQAESDNTIDTDYYAQKLKDYQEEYNNAPEQTPKRKEATIEFKNAPNSEGNKSIDIESDLGNPELASLSAVVSEDNMFSSLSFSNYNNQHVYYHPYFEATDTLSGLNISREDALKAARNTLKQLGLEGTQLSYARAGIDVEGLLGTEFSDVVSNPKRKKCYIFYFSRILKDIPVTNIEYCNGIEEGDDKEEAYDKVWLCENIEIAVDDSGVLWFRWDSPSEIGEVINANVKLKDFEEIKSIFKKQMFYERTWSFSGLSDSEITIKRAVLGLMRVRMKENEYDYIPVWDFIGDWIQKGNALKEVSFLTLNAVDGSVINRELGY